MCSIIIPAHVLFMCLCRLEFTEALDILAMFSSEGEKVVFSESISTSAARGAVEKWLLQVQDVMTLSVRDVIEQARDVSVQPLATVYTVGPHYRLCTLVHH